MPSPGVAEVLAPNANSAETARVNGAGPAGRSESHTGVDVPGSDRTSPVEAITSTEQRMTGRGGATTSVSTEDAQCTPATVRTAGNDGAGPPTTAPPRVPADPATAQSRRPPPGT
eukprot:4283553-Pyramimonas_sp.AAC.1